MHVRAINALWCVRLSGRLGQVVILERFRKNARILATLCTRDVEGNSLLG